MQIKQNTPKAIIFILIGMTVFAFQDAFIKDISSQLNLFMIYFFRSLFGIILLSIILIYRKEKIILKTNYPFLTILRGILFFIGFTLYYFSLSKLSLALAITLFFVSPFFITILSVIFLNEKIGIRRWGALIIGFIGVYLVMDPDFKDFNIYSLFPVICALAYASTMIIQKITSDKDNLFSQTYHLYFSALIFSIIIGSLIYFFDFSYYNNSDLKFIVRDWAIDSLYIFFILILIGLITVIGFLSIFEAYRIGSPPSIAPFEYVIIIWGLFLSWLIWDESLNKQGYIGLLLIISAGIYSFIRENKKDNFVTLDKPIR